jgi:hypothetical protein
VTTTERGIWSSNGFSSRKVIARIAVETAQARSTSIMSGRRK